MIWGIDIIAGYSVIPAYLVLIGVIEQVQKKGLAPGAALLAILLFVPVFFRVWGFW